VIPPQTKSNSIPSPFGISPTILRLASVNKPTFSVDPAMRKEGGDKYTFSWKKQNKILSEYLSMPVGIGKRWTGPFVSSTDVDIEEHREWGQSEPGYRDDQKTLRRAGDHADRVFRYARVQSSGAGDPVTMLAIMSHAGTIRYFGTSYRRLMSDLSHDIMVWQFNRRQDI